MFNSLHKKVIVLKLCEFKVHVSYFVPFNNVHIYLCTQKLMPLTPFKYKIIKLNLLILGFFSSQFRTVEQNRRIELYIF